jgi:hypothetical protein
MNPSDSHPSRSGMGRREGALWMLIAGSLLAAGGYALEPARASSAQDDGGGTTSQQDVILPSVALGNADSNHRMIAVTGIDITGNNVLYVIDTISAHIAVYQANGGSEGTNGIKLVAARNIGLDLRLNGWNDESEYSFEDLEAKFLEEGLLDEE